MTSRLRGAAGGLSTALLVLVAAACGGDDPTGPVFQVIEETTFASAYVNPAGDTLTVDLALMTELSSGVYIQDLVVDTLAVLVAAGDSVTVDHSGWLTSGLGFSTGQFDYIFQDSPGQVIPGFDAGIAGMRVGGKRLMILPPAQAYGDQAVGPIPPGSILIFEVDLLTIH